MTLHLIHRNKVCGSSVEGEFQPETLCDPPDCGEFEPLPPELGGTGGEEGSGYGISDLPKRVSRYGKATARQREMLQFLTEKATSLAPRSNADEDGSPKGAAMPSEEYRMAVALASAMRGCGDLLQFRHYTEADQVRLHRACFCKRDLLCPLCAIRRGNKLLEKYLEKFLHLTRENLSLQPVMLTYTVKNGYDLRERTDHLFASLKRLRDRRRTVRAGNFGATEWGKIAAAVGSIEVTYGPKTGWHPHCHIVALLDERIDYIQLSREWHEITGDSRIVDIRSLRGEPASAFCEVFKYALKFSTLTLEQNWEAYLVYTRRRKLFSLGAFRGISLPEDLTDEPLDALPYTDLFYRWLDTDRQYHQIP